MRSTLGHLCLFAALLAAPMQSVGSPLFETAGDTTSMGGLNARSSAAGAGSAAAYFNPALLVHGERGLELGTSFIIEDVNIRLYDRGPGLDVPTGIRGSNHSGTFTVDGEPVVSPSINPDSLPTEWLEDGCVEPECSPDFEARPRGGDDRSGKVRAYQTIGLLLPLFDNHLVFGFHAMIPLGSFTTAHSFYVDEREQFFSNSIHSEMYGDRMTATSLAFGVGVPLGDRLSLGVSATIALRNDAQAGTYVSDSDNQAQTLLLSTDVDVRARVTPHIGAAFEATDRWLITLTAHSPQRFDIGTGFSAALPDANEQFADRAATHDYLPWIATVGTEIGVMRGETDVDLTGTLEFSRWNTYVNRQSERPQQGFEWSDTWTPTVGARLSRGDWRVFADVSYRPTPVPEQTGRTNYVDNDRVSGATGFDWMFERPLTTIRLGLNFRAFGLLPRDNDKQTPETNTVAYERDDRFGVEHFDQLVVDEVPDDALDGSSVRGDALAGREGLQTNNPGYPGFSSGGLLWGGGLSLSFLY